MIRYGQRDDQILLTFLFPARSREKAVKCRGMVAIAVIRLKKSRGTRSCRRRQTG